MEASTASLTIEKGDTGTFTVQNYTAPLTVSVDNDEDIDVAVEGNTITVEVSSSATEGGTVTVSDAEDRTCEVTIVVIEPTEE